MLKLVNEKVKHRVFGEGIVTKFDDERVVVNFEVGQKMFQMKTLLDYLTFENKEVQKELQKAIQAMKPEPVPEPKPVKRQVKPKFERFNIAFKCNYCDGGKSQGGIGFRGVCSDKVMDYNIRVTKHVWCSDRGCECVRYKNNEITLEVLEEKLNDGGFVCYESQMLTNWEAFAGMVQNGARAGQPMKLNNVQYDSLAVLTTREPGAKEEERFVFALFMVGERHEGDSEDSGYVKAHERYRLELMAEQAKKIKFWNYYFNPNKPEVVKFGSGLHRYLSNEQSAQILRDVVELKRGTGEEALAVEFFEYFCRLNRIEEISEPAGGLLRVRED